MIIWSKTEERVREKKRNNWKWIWFNVKRRRNLKEIRNEKEKRKEISVQYGKIMIGEKWHKREIR